MARKRILITKKALEEDKHAVWNAFIDLLVTTDCDELAPSQRLARLAFLYDCEVLNGGHLQYFNNLLQATTAETIQFLDVLGGHAQALILDAALTRWNSAARLRAADLREYSAIALEGEFDDLDTAFYRCPVQVAELLERYLAKHEADFIVRE